MRKETRKKIFASALALTISVSAMPGLSYAANFPDTDGHWAEIEIDKWTEAGVLNGFEDGNFAPDAPIKGSELFNAINLVKEFDGDGENLDSENEITRQDAFALLCRVFDIAEDENGLEAFDDTAEVSDSAKAAIGGMVAAGYIHGDGGMLRPQDALTRAEMIKLLDNILGSIEEESDEPKDAEEEIAPDTAEEADDSDETYVSETGKDTEAPEASDESDENADDSTDVIDGDTEDNEASEEPAE